MRLAFAYEIQYIGRACFNPKNEIYMFTLYRKGMPGKAFTLNGVKYKCIGNATNIERMYKGARRRTAMSLKFAILLFFNLFKYRFDLIDTDSFPFLHIPLTFIYAKLTGAKLVITWHEVWSKDFWKDYFPILGFIGFFFEWLAARMGSAHIANSYTTKTLLHKILKVKTSDIYVLPAAVNEKEINDFTEKYGSSCKKENKFIVINRLVKHKRVDLAIKSIKKVNAELVIVGEGPEKENLEKLVDHYGISTRVEFKSNLTPVELYKELCTFVALIVKN